MYENHFHLNDKSEEERAADQAALVLGALNQAHSAALSVQEQVSAMFSPTVVVDEISLLFASERTLAVFVREAVRNSEYELFNTAQDVVHTSPLRREYRALYWFLRTPYDYRLELMVAGGGSPLHDERRYMLEQTENGTNMISCASMHASFKCTDEAEYADAIRVLRVHDYEMVQGCTSTYGRFSYWQAVNGSPDAPTPMWYLKPRVNLRDHSAAGLDQSEREAETRAAGE